MGVIDLILNLAALLLWLSWRSMRFDPLVRTSVSSLAGTLRRAEPLSVRGWQLIWGLLLLLFLRAVLYWVLGAPVEWTPKLRLGAVVLAFRADQFGAALIYSALGFGRVVVIFYFWLLVLAMYGKRVAEPDPVLKLIRLHLGRIARWPSPVMLLVVPLCVAGIWSLLHPVLVWAGVLARVHSAAHLAEQSLLLTVSLVLTLKFVLPVFLLLHFVASYVYLGSSPGWDFIANTARRIMAPLRWLPLRFGKLDLGPLVTTALILLVLEWLPRIVEAQLVKRGVATWPQ